MGLIRTKVPQKVYKPDFPTTLGNLPPLRFSLPRVDGISIQDVLVYHKAQFIYDADEPVIAHVQHSSITLFVNWPGYQEASSIIDVPLLSSNGQLTQAMLVIIIAGEVAMLLRKCSEEPCSRSTTEYRVANDSKDISGVYPKDVYLKGIYNTFDGIWQVDMEIQASKHKSHGGSRFEEKVLAELDELLFSINANSEPQAGLKNTMPRSARLMAFAILTLALVHGH